MRRERRCLAGDLAASKNAVPIKEAPLSAPTVKLGMAALFPELALFPAHGEADLDRLYSSWGTWVFMLMRGGASDEVDTKGFLGCWWGDCPPRFVWPLVVSSASACSDQFIHPFCPF